MNIKGYEVSEHTIRSYLRACRYNQSTATTESDQAQREAHQEVFDEIGIDKNHSDYIKIVEVLDQLVCDLLMKGY